MKILILGHKGMLGHMVHKVLKKTNYQIVTTELRWPTKEFVDFTVNFDGDFIINCIGAIHQRTKNFEVNWELPEFLDKETKCKIIHPGTDCEMDNDDYGVSKRKAKEYIINHGIKTKSLKTSIIGPELNSKASLMEWFLSSQESKLFGFSEYYWNGNTTLTWANVCLDIINDWESFLKETIISSECISKYEILFFLKEIFNKNVELEKKTEPKINKCLQGHIKKPHIKEQLIELKEFIKNN